MSEKPDKLTFAAIGDLHVKEDRTLSFRELFAELSTKAKVLVLCGDLTDLGKPSEAELLAEDLRACSVPVVGVLGNHDYESGQTEDVKRILKGAGMHLLNGQSYEIDGVAFVGVKGFIGGFGRRMLASFGEPLEILPFLGSSRLGETIDRFKVSAVVHGHAHQGRYEGRTPGGARVYNVARSIEKPTGRPYALIEV